MVGLPETGGNDPPSFQLRSCNGGAIISGTRSDAVFSRQFYSRSFMKASIKKLCPPCQVVLLGVLLFGLPSSHGLASDLSGSLMTSNLEIRIYPKDSLQPDAIWRI